MKFQSLIKKICFVLTFIFCFYEISCQNIVATNGRSITVNGSSYIIKGVCYSPVKKGSDRFAGTDLSQLDKDIQLMVAACINTIRLYAPVDNTEFYDKLNKAGIKAIVGFPNYDDTKNYSDISSGSYLTFIEKYKDHPAILFWELGNEYNYHPEWFNNNLNNWYTILNNAALAIKEIDTNHPVSTAHGEVPASNVFTKCPDIDVWGMNVYRWDNSSGAANDFVARSAKPFYFSEAGADRINNGSLIEDQTSHAKALANIWKNTEKVIQNCSGVTLFSFVDEWWKAGSNNIHDKGGFTNTIPYDNYANEEWFGLVDIDRNTTKGYDTIKSIFCNYLVTIPLKNEGTGVYLSPIPAKDLIYFKTKGVNYVNNYTIYSFDGRIIEKHKNKYINNGIDISNLLPNWYIIQINTYEASFNMKFKKE